MSIWCHQNEGELQQSGPGMNLTQSGQRSRSPTNIFFQIFHIGICGVSQWSRSLERTYRLQDLHPAWVRAAQRSPGSILTCIAQVMTSCCTTATSVSHDEYHIQRNRDVWDGWSPERAGLMGGADGYRLRCQADQRRRHPPHLPAVRPPRRCRVGGGVQTVQGRIRRGTAGGGCLQGWIRRSAAGRRVLTVQGRIH